MLRQDGVECLVDKSRLTRAADTCDENKFTQRELHIDILQVITTTTAEPQTLAVALAPGCWNLDIPVTTQILCRNGVCLHHLIDGALEHHLTAFASSFRTDIHDIVGIEHHVTVVLHSDDGITEVTQFLEGADESVVVPLMQSDTGLIKDIQHVDEL